MHELPIPHIKINHVKVAGSSIADQSFDVLRLDEIHPEISGNKWFKLKFYLSEARSSRKKRIITYGGAWSNHLLATAAACQLMEFECTGIVRGDEISRLSPILAKAKDMGMQLIFMPRDEYREKKLPAGLASEENYLIPEGGYGRPGVIGAATILDHVPPGTYSHICCAVGTGTTLAGLTSEAHASVGISVLKNNFGLEKEINALLPDQTHPYSLIHDYAFGGYAKYNDELTGFMNAFYHSTGIPTDIVYTGKLFFGVKDLVEKGYFPGGSRILVIHSGGLAGNASIPPGTLLF